MVSACQFQSQRTLYAGSHAHRTDARSPVACSNGTNSNLQRVASSVPNETYLSAQLECLYHRNSHKGHSWTGCPCQPSDTGSPPNQDFQRVKLQTPKGMGLGGPGPPRSPRMARIRAEQAKELLLKWEHLLAPSDLDLGKTPLIKHKTEVTDGKPFKENY